MKNNNYNINDFRTVPIEMTPTYAIERELSQRSILELDNDPYDNALIEELNRRYDFEKEYDYPRFVSTSKKRTNKQSNKKNISGSSESCNDFKKKTC